MKQNRGTLLILIGLLCASGVQQAMPPISPVADAIGLGAVGAVIGFAFLAKKEARKIKALKTRLAGIVRKKRLRRQIKQAISRKKGAKAGAALFGLIASVYGLIRGAFFTYKAKQAYFRWQHKKSPRGRYALGRVLDERGVRELGLQVGAVLSRRSAPFAVHDGEDDVDLPDTQLAGSVRGAPWRLTTDLSRRWSHEPLYVAAAASNGAAVEHIVRIQASACWNKRPILDRYDAQFQNICAPIVAAVVNGDDWSVQALKIAALRQDTWELYGFDDAQVAHHDPDFFHYWVRLTDSLDTYLAHNPSEYFERYHFYNYFKDRRQASVRFAGQVLGDDSLIHLAAQHGSGRRVIKTLLAGEEPAYKKMLVNAYDSFGLTPLDYVLRWRVWSPSGYVWGFPLLGRAMYTFQALLENGANPERADGLLWHMLEMLRQFQSNEKAKDQCMYILKELVKHGLRLDVRNANGMTVEQFVVQTMPTLSGEFLYSVSNEAALYKGESRFRSDIAGMVLGNSDLRDKISSYVGGFEE